jgi:hypothetical protein
MYTERLRLRIYVCKKNLAHTITETKTVHVVNSLS